MKTPPFDAIIFDHDGTLVDTESPDFEACRILCQEFGLTLTVEQWASKVVGRMDGYNELFAELLQIHPNGVAESDLWQRLKELWEITLEHVELMPGVSDLLPRLRVAGYPLGVATASDRRWATRWLTHFNLTPYFEVVAHGDDVVNNKPAPDVYLLAASRLGARPERCLVFEDSLPGVQSAKAAGMRVIAVPSYVTQTLDFSQADGIAHGLQNVSVAWIEALVAK